MLLSMTIIHQGIKTNIRPDTNLHIQTDGQTDNVNGIKMKVGSKNKIT